MHIIDLPEFPQSISVVQHPLSDLSNDAPPADENVLAPPVQHGACLTLQDHDRLRVFIQEFVVKALLPWAERTIRTLHDQVIYRDLQHLDLFEHKVTSRKGLSKGILGIGKKWFGGNKPGGTPGAAEKTNVV